MSVELYQTRSFKKDRILFTAKDGSLWCTFCRPFWDVPAWIWWWLTRGDKKWVKLGGGPVFHRVRAVCLSKSPLRVG